MIRLTPTQRTHEASARAQKLATELICRFGAQESLRILRELERQLHDDRLARRRTKRTFVTPQTAYPLETRP